MEDLRHGAVIAVGRLHHDGVASNCGRRGQGSGNASCGPKEQVRVARECSQSDHKCGGGSWDGEVIVVVREAKKRDVGNPLSVDLQCRLTVNHTLARCRGDKRHNQHIHGKPGPPGLPATARHKMAVSVAMLRSRRHSRRHTVIVATARGATGRIHNFAHRAPSVSGTLGTASTQPRRHIRQQVGGALQVSAVQNEADRHRRPPPVTDRVSPLPRFSSTQRNDWASHPEHSCNSSSLLRMQAGYWQCVTESAGQAGNRLVLAPCLRV